MVCEAVDPWRRVSRVRMLQDGYTVSELTATAAVERVLAGGRRPASNAGAGVRGGLHLGLGCASLDVAPARIEERGMIPYTQSVASQEVPPPYHSPA